METTNEIVMRYVEQARVRYFNIKSKPERYRYEGELEKAEGTLIQIECLAIELGLIETGTI